MAPLTFTIGSRASVHINRRGRIPSPLTTSILATLGTPNVVLVPLNGITPDKLRGRVLNSVLRKIDGKSTIVRAHIQPDNCMAFWLEAR